MRYTSWLVVVMTIILMTGVAWADGSDDPDEEATFNVNELDEATDAADADGTDTVLPDGSADDAGEEVCDTTPEQECLAGDNTRWTDESCHCIPGFKPKDGYEVGDLPLECESKFAHGSEQWCHYYGWYWDGESCMHPSDAFAQLFNGDLEYLGAYGLCDYRSDDRHVAWDNETKSCVCVNNHVPVPVVIDGEEVPTDPLTCRIDPEISEADCNVDADYTWYDGSCLDRVVAESWRSQAADSALRTDVNKNQRVNEQQGRDIETNRSGVAENRKVNTAQDRKLNTILARMGLFAGISVIGHYGSSMDVEEQEHNGLLYPEIHYPAGNLFPTFTAGIRAGTGKDARGLFELRGFIGGHTGFTTGGGIGWYGPLGPGQTVKLGPRIDLAYVGTMVNERGEGFARSEVGVFSVRPLIELKIELIRWMDVSVHGGVGLDGFQTYGEYDDLGYSGQFGLSLVFKTPNRFEDE